MELDVNLKLRKFKFKLQKCNSSQVLLLQREHSHTSFPHSCLVTFSAEEEAWSQDCSVLVPLCLPKKE